MGGWYRAVKFDWIVLLDRIKGDSWALEEVCNMCRPCQINWSKLIFRALIMHQLRTYLVTFTPAADWKLDIPLTGRKVKQFDWQMQKSYSLIVITNGSSPTVAPEVLSSCNMQSFSLLLSLFVSLSPLRASSTTWSTPPNCPPGWRMPPSRRRCSPTPSGTTSSATRRCSAWRSTRTTCTACRGWRAPASATSTWSGFSTALARWRRYTALRLFSQASFWVILATARNYFQHWFSV